MDGPESRPKLILSPAWERRLRDAAGPGPAPAPRPPILPRAVPADAGAIAVVEDLAGADAMHDLARQRPIGFGALDCAYRHATPGVLVKQTRHGERRWQDPTSIEPLLMGLVLVEAGSGGAGRVHRFAVDLRRAEVLGPLGRLLRRPLPFAAHSARGDLFCLWRLGLPTPESVWDTWVAERAARLGLDHPRYRLPARADGAEAAQGSEEAEAEREASLSLASTCRRHGVPHPLAADQARLRRSFLGHPGDAPFGAEQHAHAVAVAEAAARLYPIQVLAAVAHNALDHLKHVEMDWSVTNARMAWDGVRVDPDRCRDLLSSSDGLRGRLSARLEAMGLADPRRRDHLARFFEGAGLLDAFREGGSLSFDDDHLEAVDRCHPAIPLLRALRKVDRLVGSKMLTGELVGTDGRLHPDHRVLGAESGRDAMRDPNVGGIGKALRPLVVPRDGRAIGEVDLGQIEVMIAAALSGDAGLLAMVNGRDVYSAMARVYFAGEIDPGDLDLPDSDFKRRHRDRRDQMKVYTLAIIYNITAAGLARLLGVEVRRAEAERSRFLAMFPGLDRALREASAYGAIRGYAELCTGLRRRRARGGRPTAWEENWLRNTPIQGSACVVFKVAGNRLRRRYEHHDARLVLPLHDAFVFECPREHLEAVAGITAEVMRSAVQEYFPALDPRVEVNIEHPGCWNKDGKHRSLELWMDDPALAREYLGS
jgi:DNA polymerase-1